MVLREPEKPIRNSRKLGHAIGGGTTFRFPYFIRQVTGMDIGSITQIIGSLGFPIAACIAMFSMLNKERDAHKEEMTELKQAITNNTLALQSLADKLDK